MTQVSESEYRTAQESQDPCVRQKFLDAIDLEDNANFVRKIKYDTDKLGDTLAYVTPLDSLIIAFRSPINVFPLLFECPYNEMLSIIIDHEGHHARQIRYRNIPESIGKFFSIYPGQKARDYRRITEATAINNELLNAEKRKLSKGTIAYRKVQMAQYLQGCKFSEKKLNKQVLKNLCGKPKSKELQEILEKGAETFLREYSDEWQNEKQMQPINISFPD